MIKIAAILSIILVVVTGGCGFAIHFGGKDFSNAIKGHMILGIACIIAVTILSILVLVGKKG